MTCKTCKDCPARYPACHDYCPQFAAWRKEHAKETDYNRKMTVSGRVYRYDYEDKHRERGRKRYLGANGGVKCLICYMKLQARCSWQHLQDFSSGLFLAMATQLNISSGGSTATNLAFATGAFS